MCFMQVIIFYNIYKSLELMDCMLHHKKFKLWCANSAKIERKPKESAQQKAERFLRFLTDLDTNSDFHMRPKNNDDFKQENNMYMCASGP
jgi:hypothetical protein